MEKLGKNLERLIERLKNPDDFRTELEHLRSVYSFHECPLKLTSLSIDYNLVL